MLTITKTCMSLQCMEKSLASVCSLAHYIFFFHVSNYYAACTVLHYLSTWFLALNKCVLFVMILVLVFRVSLCRSPDQSLGLANKVLVIHCLQELLMVSMLTQYPSALLKWQRLHGFPVRASRSEYRLVFSESSDHLALERYGGIGCPEASLPGFSVHPLCFPGLHKPTVFSCRLLQCCQAQ